MAKSRQQQLPLRHTKVLYVLVDSGLLQRSILGCLQHCTIFPLDSPVYPPFSPISPHFPPSFPFSLTPPPNFPHSPRFSRTFHGSWALYGHLTGCLKAKPSRALLRPDFLSFGCKGHKSATFGSGLVSGCTGHLVLHVIITASIHGCVPLLLLFFSSMACTCCTQG